MTGITFKYFLNAIFYCIWIKSERFDSWFETWIERLIAPIVNFIPKYLYQKKLKKKYYRNKVLNKKRMDDFRHNRKHGTHMESAKDLFGKFFTGYFLFATLMFYSCLILCDLSNVFITIGISIIFLRLCYIPINKMVFSNYKYLEYFKLFEKNDEQWHKKWNRITTVFCISAIILFFAGPFSMLGLLILLD